jgi:hypothetical protein
MYKLQKKITKEKMLFLDSECKYQYETQVEGNSFKNPYRRKVSNFIFIFLFVRPSYLLFLDLECKYQYETQVNIGGQFF